VFGHDLILPVAAAPDHEGLNAKRRHWLTVIVVKGSSMRQATGLVQVSTSRQGLLEVTERILH
jgi:hypothetical protein